MFVSRFMRLHLVLLACLTSYIVICGHLLFQCLWLQILLGHS